MQAGSTSTSTKHTKLHLPSSSFPLPSSTLLAMLQSPCASTFFFAPTTNNRSPPQPYPLPSASFHGLYYCAQGGYTEDYPHASEPFYAAMAHKGFVVLAFNQAGFGLRIDDKKPFYKRAANLEWSLLGRIVADVSSALDAITANQNGPFPDGTPLSGLYDGARFPAVDPKRVYVVGYAMGGVAALYSAALDSRVAGVACVAGISPLRNASLELDTGSHRRLYEWHALQPRLGGFRHNASSFPYDYDDILRVISPRKSLVVAPQQDRTANIPALNALLDGLTGGAEPLDGLTVKRPMEVNILNDSVMGAVTSWLQQFA